MSTPATVSTVSDRSLAENIIGRVDAIIREAERASQPLEVDPARAQLFELFVTAEAAGFVEAGAAADLTADGLCRALALRWGLKTAVEHSFQSQTKLPPGQLGRMRSLWSVMRMWMEWAYAWQRWPEFHQDAANG